MSQLLIQTYLNELSDLKRLAGSSRESVVREAFKTLLKSWGRGKGLVFVPEYEIEAPDRQRRYVDGALLSEIRLPFGYWEAKDEKDNLDEEIVTKFRRGYPQDNIIFEDSREAVLIQNRKEVVRADVQNPERLEHLLKLFFDYERIEIADFRRAVEQFKTDLPKVLEALREKIEDAFKGNALFKADALSFLKHAQQTINPSITADDVREMLIQHILTEEIFSKVFGEDDFHRQNNVAQKLYALERAFFTGNVKRQTLRSLEPYYSAIRASAAQISSHHEKQAFLKVVYENFYKVYNKKAADRLGVVYTPNEIVRFMIESADWLTQKHFGKRLIDKGVEILDPATGTGTFITELLEHFRGQPEKLKYKYREELHANEVAILSYYVANLNIEATYSAITDEYIEYPNLCFVDTLDNVAGLQKYAGHQDDLFGAMSEENVERIKRQNRRKISVVIGNPPYNANQQSENDNNKNRTYPGIDKRISDTYIAASKARKTKLYDMYVRFFRWASDRVDERGVVAFITNRSFIDAMNFDGFRKKVAEDFSDIFVIDLGGDFKKRGVAGGGNVFGIGTGVAISFWVKTSRSPSGASKARIRYASVEPVPGPEKLSWVSQSTIQSLDWKEVSSSSGGFWVDNPTEDYGASLPMVTPETKKRGARANAIFEIYSLGVSTNRDEWLYDRSRAALESKAAALVRVYDSIPSSSTEYPDVLKWSRNLKRKLAKRAREPFLAGRIVPAAYRPFTKRYLYQSPLFVDELGQSGTLFPAGNANVGVSFSAPGHRADFCVLAIDGVSDLHFGASVDGYQQVARYRFKEGKRLDNITDWALRQFRSHYSARNLEATEKRFHEKSVGTGIGKDDIFHYVYGVLHDPVYRETYALNLKREFPRIPFYDDFAQWVAWGERLMKLHIGYEQVKPYGLKRTDVPDMKSRNAGVPPQTLLKVDKGAGVIKLDSETSLTGVPEIAWTYRLGNRSALEWVLDQHKEKALKDSTLRTKFNTYKFADYKEKVVDLLDRVTRVSVDTMQIIGDMRRLRRG